MKTFARIIIGIIITSTALLNSGCQSGPAYRQGFDFSRYRTFAIEPLPTKGTYEDPAIALRLGPSVKKAIVETLTAKGFKEVTRAESDFQVKLRFDYLPEHNRVETRMLDIQFIDGQSQEIVWSTWLRRTTDNPLPPEAISKLIADLLKPFPPGSQPH